MTETPAADSARIILIDDHPLLRHGIKQLVEFERELEIVGDASNAEDGVRLAVAEEPDLILLDLNMPEVNGIETLKRLRDEGVQSRIVIFTVSDHEEDVVAALRAGADGYLLKDMEPEELIERLREAALGRMVISDRLTALLAQALRSNQPETPEVSVDTLTGREREILALIAEGLPNKLIARRLDISDGTVKVHVKHILKKLNLRSRVEVAVWAVEKGIKKT
ncbi:two-component system response regulator NarL [Marinobacteraceae bacterium S3BR75-40.1]